VTGENGGMSDVFGYHGFTQSVTAEEDDVSGFVDEVERKRLRDDVAVDFARPVPVEIGDGLEAADACEAETALEAEAGTLVDFDIAKFIKNISGGPMVFSGARKEIVKVLSQ